MDTEEMFRRGVADAERGEVHPFYYQHYYHYRRGYDRAYRQLHGPFSRLGRPVVLLIGIVAVLALAVLGTRWSQQSRTPQQRPAVALATTPTTLPPTSLPTSQPIFPTAEPTPTPEPPALHVDGQAIVSNISGAGLRGRRDPNLKGRVQISFKAGEQVHILEGPVDADGYRWWRIEGKNGSGWSAERSLDGIAWLEPAAQ